MSIIQIRGIEEEGLLPYVGLTERQLRNGSESESLFIAESPKVIKVALEEGYEPVSLLCEKKHIDGDAAEIITKMPEIPVYTGQRELLASLTGYKLTRGVLCAMKRKKLPTALEICEEANRVAVIEAVCDTTNIGSIFRTAAALGIDGILLTPDSCDPLNRRAVRVSMGAVFKIPWTFTEKPIEILRDHSFTTIALALRKDARPIDDPVLRKKDKIALVLGTEGEGLTEEMIAACDYSAIIPMHRMVDSLNVGVAAAVAFWELRKKEPTEDFLRKSL